MRTCAACNLKESPPFCDFSKSARLPLAPRRNLCEAQGKVRIFKIVSRPAGVGSSGHPRAPFGKCAYGGREGLRELGSLLLVLTILLRPEGPVAQWIRHRPTEPGIAGSRPAGVIATRGQARCGERYLFKEKPRTPAHLARALWRALDPEKVVALRETPVRSSGKARTPSAPCAPSSAYASAPCALPPGFACSRSLQCSPARRTIGSGLERGSECWGGSRCPDLAKGRHTAARISLSPKARWKPWKH